VTDQKYIKRVSGSSTRFVYDLNVTDEMLSDEVHAKYILSNSVNDQIKRRDKFLCLYLL